MPQNNFSIDELIEYISRGHAYPKHLEGADPRSSMSGVNAFSETHTNPIGTNQTRASLGPSLHIRSPEDLAEYTRRMLESPATKGFVKVNSDGVEMFHFYNSTDNTYLIVNPLDRDFGSIQRYDNSASKYKDNRGSATRTFDNASDPTAAMDEITGFVDNVRNRAAKAPVPNAFQNPPGVYAQSQYPGSRNLSTSGVTSEFRTYTQLSDAGVDSGRGFVAAIDETGKPKQMFFLNEATNTVAEIRGRTVTIHDFATVPAAERAETARHFFESKNIHNVDIINGGLREVSRAFQNNTPEIFAEAIKNMDTAKGPGIPLSGSNIDQLIAHSEGARVSVRTQAMSVGEAARNAIRFRNADTALAFELVPDQMTPANLRTLAANGTDPQMIDAITELSYYKQVGTGNNVNDAAFAIKEFDNIMSGMSAADQLKAVEAINTISRTPANLARGSAAALDAVSATGDLATVAKGLRAGRFGASITKAGIVTTVAATTLAVSATAYANEVTRDLADKLLEERRITPEFHAEFKELMDDVGPVLTGQAADPTPLAIPGMFVVERMAYNRFQELSNKHQISEEIHDMLSPSIVAGTSLRGQIGRDLFFDIPYDTNNQPEELRHLIEARRNVEVARREYDEQLDAHQPNELGSALLNAPMMDAHGGGGMGLYILFHNATSEPGDSRIRMPSDIVARAAPEVQAADTALTQARAAFQSAFDRTLEDPQSARALTELLTTDQLFDIVTATAEYNSDTDNVLVQDYLKAQKVESSFLDIVGYGDSSYAISEAEKALKNNPAAMRDYISELFATEEYRPPAPAPEPTTEPEQNNLEPANSRNHDNSENPQQSQMTPSHGGGAQCFADSLDEGSLHLRGFIPDMSPARHATGEGIYEGFSTEVINLQTEDTDYTQSLKPTEANYDIYYNFDLPPIHIEPNTCHIPLPAIPAPQNITLQTSTYDVETTTPSITTRP